VMPLLSYVSSISEQLRLYSRTLTDGLAARCLLSIKPSLSRSRTAGHSGMMARLKWIKGAT
jgi:hypothetical protein